MTTQVRKYIDNHTEVYSISERNVGKNLAEQIYKLKKFLQNHYKHDFKKDENGIDIVVTHRDESTGIVGEYTFYVSYDELLDRGADRIITDINVTVYNMQDRIRRA